MPSTGPRPARRRATRLISAAVGVAAVVTLAAGCSSDSGGSGSGPGGSGNTGGASGSTGSTSSDSPATTGQTSPEDVAAQNAIATCMKQRGFTYIPHPLVTERDDSPHLRNTTPLLLLQSAADTRAWRQKYGFGGTAALVYPNDPNVAPPQDPPNPNTAIVAGLDSARRHAYNVALNGTADPKGVRLGGVAGGSGKTSAAVRNSCQTKGDKVVQKFEDGKKSAQAAKEQAAGRLFSQYASDPKVQKTSKAYIKCLAGKGLKPDSYSLAFINQAGSDGYQKRHPGADNPTAAQARAALPNEIRAALDDASCIAPLAKLVQTKYPKIPDAVMKGNAGGGVG